jgi:hypothetical protein
MSVTRGSFGHSGTPFGDEHVIFQNAAFGTSICS